MKEEFLNAIESEVNKLREQIKQAAAIDWAETYSRIDMTPTQAHNMAKRYIKHHMIQELYLHSSKTLINL